MKKIISFCFQTVLFFVLLLLTVSGQASDKTGTQPDNTPVFDAGNIASAKFPADFSVTELLRENRIHGGVIVHVGCGAGEQSGELALEGNYLVQGLDTDRQKIDQALEYTQSVGFAGRLSFKLWDGGLLPYTDNLVNVLFWQVPSVEFDMTEIMRVLTPNGVAYIKENDGWNKVVKPRPYEIDDWPHYRYDAGNTGASKDKRVGSPNRIQWEAGPRFMRSHEIETGLSSILSTNGRLYYILDEGPLGITDARFPSNWSLVCRDAFNGMLLWKRPMPNWGWQAWFEERENNPHVWHYTRNRPADVDRLMVADGDTLYVTLGFGSAVSAIDAATGRVLRTYEETAGTVELIFINGILIVRTNSPAPAIIAIHPEYGKKIWRQNASLILDRTLSASGERVFFHNRSEIVALDLKTGEEQWRQVTEIRPAGVIAHKDVVLATQAAVTLAFSTQTGKRLWMAPGSSTQGRYPDLFIIDDLVWWGRANFDARHIITGERVKKMELQKVLESGHHRRCFTDRATSNYIITGERGSEFLDVNQDNHMRNNWVRGPCVTGMLPANGLFYAPPHQCFCYPAVRMDGFFALSSDLPGEDIGPGGPTETTGRIEFGSRAEFESQIEPGSHIESGSTFAQRLEKGPAYAQTAVAGETADDDWPAYRQNEKRSGSTVSHVPTDLDTYWSANFQGNLTQAVVNDGRVFVVEKNAGTVHSLDLENGEHLWSRTVSGGIDSPPRIHKGFVIFGSRDGFVYSLRTCGGELAWRFRVAPKDRQIVSHNLLESIWPAHGSVLILDGVVYSSAGRSGFLDGGIHLYGLEYDSGEVVYHTILEGPYPDISQPSYAFHKEGFRSDLLTTDGTYLYMGRTTLDRSLEIIETERVQMIGRVRGDDLEYRIMPGMRLVATGGFLDNTLWHRTYWMHSHIWPGFQFAQQAPKSGQLLVFDDQHTYTVKYFTTRNFNSPMFFPGDGYLLFADDNNNEPLFYRGQGEPAPIEWEPKMPHDPKFVSSKPWWSIYQDAATDKGTGFTRAEPARWTSWEDVRIVAMVLADEKLIIAGPPDLVPDNDPLAALEGRMGAVLRIVSAIDGSHITEYSLESSPVFDGIIAARGRLIITTQDGNVVCMGRSGQ